MRRSALRLLLAVTLAWGSWGRAQDLSGLVGVLGQACQITGIEALCSLNDLISQVSGMASVIYAELRGLADDITGDIRNFNFERFSEYLPFEELNALLAPYTEMLSELTANAENGLSIISGMVNDGGVLTQVEDSIGDVISQILTDFNEQAAERFTNRRSPQDSPAYTFEQLVGSDPVLQLAYGLMQMEESKALAQDLQSDAIYQTADAVAEAFIQNEAAGDRTAQVISDPALGIAIPGVREPGTAATLRENVSSAPSSRVVLEHLGRGLADLQESDAIYSQITIEGQKVIAKELALNNHQLRLMTQQVATAVMEQAAQAREQLEASYIRGMLEASDDIEQLDLALESATEVASMDLGAIVRGE